MYKQQNFWHRHKFLNFFFCICINMYKLIKKKNPSPLQMYTLFSVYKCIQFVSVTVTNAHIFFVSVILIVFPFLFLLVLFILSPHLPHSRHDEFASSLSPAAIRSSKILFYLQRTCFPTNIMPFLYSTKLTCLLFIFFSLP